MRAQRKMWSGSAAGITLIAVMAAAAAGQAAPAENDGPTLVLDFHDAPANQVFAELGKLRIIPVMPAERVQQRITVVSKGPVDRMEACGLVQDALWDAGYHLVWSETAPPPGGKVNPQAPIIVAVESRTRPAAPREMRVWRPAQAAERVPAFSERVRLQGVEGSVVFGVTTLGKAMEAMRAPFNMGYEEPDFARDFLQMPQIITAGEKFNAPEAAEVIDATLAWGGKGLKVETANGKQFARAVAVTTRRPDAKKVAFTFDNAPLEDVLAELARQSGYAVTSTVKGVKVSVDETLTVTAGAADVAVVVARLNDQLAAQRATIQETSRAGTNGKREPALVVMGLDEARRTMLARPVEVMPPEPTGEQWQGVDMKGRMTFNFRDARLSVIVAEMAKQFGFVGILEGPMQGFATMQSAQPLGPVEAVKALDGFLVPLGYAIVTYPTASGKRTILRVAPMAEAKQFWIDGGSK